MPLEGGGRVRPPNRVRGEAEKTCRSTSSQLVNNRLNRPGYDEDDDGGSAQQAWGWKEAFLQVSFAREFPRIRTEAEGEQESWTAKSAVEILFFI